ncbi:hypothetical protein [Streptomyces rimosus]|uniref:hypothetical protein n=1 Tax=Streptomyces rimosus TaxID=1927 RepID=UPI0004C88FB0|nr:hypothetical protein [Streptomyces rimosus]
MRSSLPEIRVRIMRPDEPDAMPWWEFDPEDAAEIRACRKMPYAVEVIDAAGRLLGDVSNLVAGAGIEGTYRSPREIPDRTVAYYATDCWTSACGIEPGTLFRLLGHHHRVLGYEQVDQEYGDIGYATGRLICQPTRGGRLVRVSISYATRQVRELTAPRCSAIGCFDWATHKLETDPCDPLVIGRIPKPVCEPCGTSFMTEHAQLNPTLTEGTV